MIIELPVSAISRKILLKEFGSVEPIMLRHNDIVYQMLLYNTKLRYPHRMRRLLGKSISIQVNGLTSEQAQQAFLAGYHIHKYHIIKMYDFVWARHLVNDKIAHAIRDFNRQYDINEDDIPYETQYRNWTRYITKKEKSVENNGTIVRQSNEESIVISIPLSESEIDQLTTEIITTNNVFFIDAKRQPLVVLPKRLKLYLLYYYGKYTVAAISELNDMKQRTAYKHIQLFKEYLAAKHPLRLSVNEIVTKYVH